MTYGTAIQGQLQQKQYAESQMNTTQTQIRETPAIPEALNHLAAAVCELDGTLGELARRIEPVMYADTPNNSAPEPDVRHDPEVAYQIRSHAASLLRLSQAVAKLIQRVQL